jgi:lipoate-protein ligase A
MFICDLTLPTPEENLACDEVLLELCERGAAGGLLRFWEPAQYFVVVGYANKAGTEADLAYCRQNRIPVLRRCSGGGTVVQGPGCLNYTLILPVDSDRALAGIPATNDFVLGRHQAALTPLLRAPVERQGHTDLAISGLKFSGNAQRRRQRFLLFHGSFLLHLDIGLVEKALPLPSKQPHYRANRSHSDFLTNLKVPSRLIKAALAEAWQAATPLGAIPLEQIRRLAEEKYRSDQWNLRS